MMTTQRTLQYLFANGLNNNILDKFLLDFVDRIISEYTLTSIMLHVSLREYVVIQHLLCRYPSNSAAFANNLKSKSTPTPKWRRVVFKISGTALAGNCQSIDPKVLVSNLFYVR